VRMAERLGLKTFVHDRNYGYGRNQQTCYREALAAGADIVVMVHPDYQYTLAGDAYGRHGRSRRLRCSPRLEDYRRRRAQRRNASLQIRGKPVCDRPGF